MTASTRLDRNPRFRRSEAFAKTNTNIEKRCQPLGIFPERYAARGLLGGKEKQHTGSTDVLLSIREAEC